MEFFEKSQAAKLSTKELCIGVLAVHV